MARGVNKVILVGNLGQDPEVRYMPNGNGVANISIATTDSWKDKNTGQMQERTEWHRVVLFGKLAEVAGEYLRKGQSWEQVEENRKRMFDVCPDVFIFLATCLNAYNCFHVPNFHHEWIQKGWIDAVGGSLINPLFVPEELSIKILPPRMKEQLTKRYKQEQKWFDDYTNNTEKRYDKLIHFLYEADHTHLIPKFWERTNMVDKLRQEDCLTLFPELQDLKSPQLV